MPSESHRCSDSLPGVRMRAMILFSLLAVAFSLPPVALQRYGLDASSVWRLSSALGAAAALAVGVWVAASIRRLAALGIAAQRPRKVIRGIAGVLGSAIPGCVVLLGYTALRATPTGAVHATGLLLLLFLAGFAFSLIVFSFLPSLEAPEWTPLSQDERVGVRRQRRRAA